MSTVGTGLRVLLVLVFVPITLLLSMFGKKGAVAPGVSPTTLVADVLVLAHISGERPRLVVVNTGAPA